MKTYRITATIQCDDSFDEYDVVDQIERDLNRGDGLKLLVDQAEVEMVVEKSS